MPEPPTSREPEVGSQADSQVDSQADPQADSWILLARLAAVAGVAALALQIFLLLTLAPVAERCPDWRPGGATATSLWTYVTVVSVPCTLFACLVARAWRRFARRIVGPYAQVPPWFRRGPPRDRQRFFAPATTATACACGIAAAFAATPLLLIASCVEWLTF